VRVVVADDSVLLREGLVRLLTEVDCEVAEGCSNAAIAECLVITSRGGREAHLHIFAKINLPDVGSDNRRVLAVLAWLRAR
jgi:DNA-binding NarL/FixJ family response regulator